MQRRQEDEDERNDIENYQRQQEQLQQHLMNASPDEDRRQKSEGKQKIDFYGDGQPNERKQIVDDDEDEEAELDINVKQKLNEMQQQQEEEEEDG